MRVKDIAIKHDVTQHTVIAWIANGELVAVDVSRKKGGKPRWRITPEALAAFEISRMPIPPMPKAKRRSRQRDEGVLDFYPPP